jgi:peptidoglycan/LPS O-acetylase OafA/YrhL
LNKDSKAVRYVFADGLRGLAALWVVLYHLSEGHHIENIKAVLTIPVSHFVFDSGWLGVRIFFVLSGFVMANNTVKYQVEGNFANKFILRRLIRLTPPYYFAIFFTLIFLALKQHVLGTQIQLPEPNVIAAHFFYMQGFLGFKNINPVFWTLCIELQFYVAFIIMVWFSDYLVTQCKIHDARYWLAGLSSILALPWAFGWLQTPIWAGGFIGFWYSFMAGVLVCWAIFANRIFQWFTIGYLLLIIGSVVFKHSDAVIVTGLTATSLFFAGVKGYMQRWLNWRWLQFVGLVSYSLYLLHNPLTGASANLLRRILSPSLLTDIIVTLAAISFCLFMAWLNFICIEKPSIRWSHVVKPNKFMNEA